MTSSRAFSVTTRTTTTMSEIYEGPLRYYNFFSDFYRMRCPYATNYGGVEKLAEVSSLLSYLKARLDWSAHLQVSGVMEGQPVFSFCYGQGSLVLRPDGAFRLHDSYTDTVTTNRLTKHLWFTNGYDMYKRTLIMRNGGFRDNWTPKKQEWLDIRNPDQRLFNMRPDLLAKISRTYWVRLVAPTADSLFSDVGVEFSMAGEWDGVHEAFAPLSKDLPFEWLQHEADILARRERFRKKLTRRKIKNGENAYYAPYALSEAVEALSSAVAINRRIEG